MLLLAIESAGPGCSVALWDLARAESEACLGQRSLGAREGQADRLIALIDGLMAESAVSYHALELIGVDIGPGSFTGVRTGVAAARALALATGLRVCPVTGLEVLAVDAVARASGRRPACVLAALDARRGEIYAQVFNAALAPQSPPAVIRPEQAFERVRPPVHVVGSGAELVRAACPDGMEMSVAAGELDACAVARCVARRLAEGVRPVAGAEVRPLYLRAPDARPQQPAFSSARVILAGAEPCSP